MKLSESFEGKAFTATFAVMSAELNIEASNKKLFHRFQISDGFSIQKLIVWEPEFVKKPEEGFRGSYIEAIIEPVKAKENFFSCNAANIKFIPFEKLPALDTREGIALRGIEFRANVDISQLLSDIRQFVDMNIEHEGFKKLIYSLTTPEIFEKIRKAPAAHGVHHAIEGGLVLHIKEMFEIYVGIALSNFEGAHDLRHEFVILGILLHDFYKFKDYEELPDGAFKITEDYVLLGHLYAGAQFLQRCIKNVTANDPDSISEKDTKIAIHCLLAHHGELEWGSPVVPAVKEATLLHYIDQISAKFNMFKNSSPLVYNKYLKTSPLKEY